MQIQLLKRLRQELKSYQKTPLLNTSVQPREENFSLWDALIVIDLPDIGQAPMRLSIQYPDDYPVSPPKVGFAVSFAYNNGAQEVIREGPLTGKFGICLDLLGNYAHLHTEWADTKGSKGTGWSPAYNVSTLLVNLQSVLLESSGLSSSEVNRQLYKDCVNYHENNPVDGLEFTPSMTSKESQCKGSPFDYASSNLEIPSNIKVLCDNLYQSIASAEDNENFCKVVSFFLHGDSGIEIGEAMVTEEDITAPFDEGIFCWYSFESYKDDILGFGIKIEQKGTSFLLSTDGNMISKGAYFDAGLRLSPNKEAFEEFIPAWINSDHAEKNDLWVEEMKNSIKRIAARIGIPVLENPANVMFVQQYQDSLINDILRIFPEIVNTMVVKMMDSSSDFRASERIFVCILSFWRCFYYLSLSIPGLRKKILSKVLPFITTENSRRKNVTPNIGHILVMSTILQHGEREEDKEGGEGVAFSWSDFLDAYESESFLRRVLWWKKDNIRLTPSATYSATEISRSNVLFQTLFKKAVLREDMVSTLRLMERTNCQMPDRLTDFLEDWRALVVRARETPTWEQFFKELVSIGFPKEKMVEITASMSNYLAHKIAHADTLEGYKYIPRGGGRDHGRYHQQPRHQPWEQPMQQPFGQPMMMMRMQPMQQPWQQPRQHGEYQQYGRHAPAPAAAAPNVFRDNMDNNYHDDRGGGRAYRDGNDHNGRGNEYYGRGGGRNW